MTVAAAFSVVMPAFNAATYIERTLATVAAQTYPPLELLVVDDGSTDDTCAIVESFGATVAAFRVLLLRTAHRGPGAARNAGVRAARADWVAFLDADDLWRPAKLERARAAIEEYPDSNFFCHNERVLHVDGHESVNNYGAAHDPSRPLAAQLYERNLFSTSAVVSRRDDILAAGGFDEGLPSAQDYELWLRMAPRLRPTFLDEELGSYVERIGNITTTRRWRRLGNIVRVHVRHRAYVGTTTFMMTVLRHVAAYTMDAVRGLGRRGGSQ